VEHFDLAGQPVPLFGVEERQRSWSMRRWALYVFVKSGSTPVGGPVKSGRKRTRAEVRGLGRG